MRPRRISESAAMAARANAVTTAGRTLSQAPRT